MDTNRKRPLSNTTTTEANGWKSKDRRNMMVKKINSFMYFVCAEYYIQRDPLSWSHKVPHLLKSVEKFEEEVFESAKDETEYIRRISAKTKEIRAPLPSNESNLLSSKGSGSESFLRNPYSNLERRDVELRIEIQMIKSKYCAKLNILYKGLSKRFDQLKAIQQQPKTSDLLKCEHHMRALEYTFALFKANKNQITSDFEQKIDRMENYIQLIEQHKIVTPKSKLSQVEGTSSEKVEETSAKKQTTQVLSLHNSHSTKPNFYQVTNQFSTSHAQEESVRQQGYGNVVQQQTSGESSPISSSYGILASPLLENCSKVKETFQDHSVNCDDSSPAMQHLIKVLTSVSAEALVASCGEIGIISQLNEDTSTLEPLNGPPIRATDSDSEGVLVTDSQARYLSRRKFGPIERKLNRFFDAVPINDNFMQTANSEKHFSSSSIVQENYTLLEEIKEINKQLIDTEVVIEKSEFPTFAEGQQIAHGEGLTVKLFFNSVTVNLNPISDHDDFSKKPIIKPLWLHIPTNYPNSSAVILDEMARDDDSKDLEDLSMKAKLKLRVCLRRLNQPLLLKDIAMSWDHCAREAICEYAQLHGGGTFTSKYGGWETCFDPS
ncbi:unnamed protein product [Sphenostylis stenocarpa]|uniref:Mediator complex subunit 15 KIX domain-containing protein n=1 Tax=Sphenostylis stenocarpa TaxID=92480 RepID=A0AA86SPF6_9FABA|nr:unnamed protein product [Sphenostylis stenocarpa]